MHTPHSRRQRCRYDGAARHAIASMPADDSGWSGWTRHASLCQVTQCHPNAMNGLLFHARRPDASHASMLEGRELPPPPETQPVPDQAARQTPPHHSEESQNKLVKQSSLTKPQAIRALYRIRLECNTICDMLLFCTSALRWKAIPLDDLPST